MEDRVRRISDGDEKKGRCVVYWMQGSQRSRYNHSLEYAVLEAERLDKPLIVVFNVFADYPEANYRHYYFMLEGLIELQKNLMKRGIDFIVTRGELVENICRIAEDASALICDKGYLRHEKNWREAICEGTQCPVTEVESNLVVPVERASHKEEYSARTIRGKISRILEDYLYDFQYESLRKYTKKDRDTVNTLKKQWKDIIFSLEEGAGAAADSLGLDTSVDRVELFRGGEDEGARRLEDFIEGDLDRYDRYSSSPEIDCVSHLSPYLHFGQISPVEIAQRVLKEKTQKNTPSVDGFIEELIIRRELAFNFVYYNQNYDRWEGITYPWAYDTLMLHSADEREYLYTRKEFEDGQTHDKYWNAAMKEMVNSGFMHGYMRMYWCKKILEWSQTPKEAYETAIYLNNRYFIDGRDPNSYTGVAWCFGKHDRGWKERAVYGKVRCMMASGLKRKFDMEEYIKRVDKL